MSYWSQGRIQHPDWVIDAEKSVHSVVELYKLQRLPNSIEVPMIVTPMRRMLRGIYGSNMKAAWALLKWAINSLIRDLWNMHWIPFWNLTVLRKTREEWAAELDAELDGDSEAAEARRADGV